MCSYITSYIVIAILVITIANCMFSSYPAVLIETNKRKYREHVNAVTGLRLRSHPGLSTSCTCAFFFVLLVEGLSSAGGLKSSASLYIALSC